MKGESYGKWTLDIKELPSGRWSVAFWIRGNKDPFKASVVKGTRAEATAKAQACIDAVTPLFSEDLQ